LGLDQVPVMVARGWSDAQKKAYLIADNKLTLNAAWDQELLKLEAADLAAMGFDLQLTGFSLNEIEGLGLPDNNALAEWAGMPEFEQNLKKAHKTLIVYFKDAEALKEFCHLINQPVGDKTKFIWYPQIELDSYQDSQYRETADAASEVCPAG